MRGRRPKPSYLRVLDGNAGHRPANVDEPIVSVGLSEEPPPWMTDEQAAIYRVAVQSAPPGLLRTLDASVLETWVVARATHQQCVRALSQTGLVVRSAKGVTRNPYVIIMNMQAKELIRAAAELGFTPSSRSRVKIEKQKTINRFAHLKTQA